MNSVGGLSCLLLKSKACDAISCMKNSGLILRPVLGGDNSGGPNVAKNLNGVADQRQV